MNNKQCELLRIVNIVVGCCATEIDDNGTMSLTVEDVLSPCRAENVVMTRCIVVDQILSAGFSVTTCAQLLHRTPRAIRQMQQSAITYRQTSRAYRIADAEATIKCKEIDIRL